LSRETVTRLSRRQGFPAGREVRLAEINLHTYTGWGSVPYWNAFAANLEMQGVGNFDDDRLANAKRWSLHTGQEVCTDNFQADRSPTLRCRTTSLRGIVAKMKGGFYHGRFPTLGAVVDHYDGCFKLGLSPREKSDLVQYLLGL
jgi:hypothetical protein